MTLKEGDLVKVNKKEVKKINGHYWHNCLIIYISNCGRYVKFEGNISYSKKKHTGFTEIKNLIKDNR